MGMVGEGVENVWIFMDFLILPRYLVTSIPGTRERKLRVAWHGLSNTRARRTNTAKRAPNMPMQHRHVPVHVCTISILWNFHTNPYQSQ